MKMRKRYVRYYDFTLGIIPPHKAENYEAPNLKSHYERLGVQEPFYFYVKKKEPSEVEGALLVGEEELINIGIDPRFPDGKRLVPETEESKKERIDAIAS